jgi:uncharacterized protein (TIGR02271 family)
MSQPTPPSNETRVIPVVEEVLDVWRRRVETGKVRITKVVHAHIEEVSTPQVREEITIERVPLNRMVDAPLAMRQEGDTLSMPVLEEVVVTEKRFMVTEELRITTRRIEEQAAQRVTLRREEVIIERLDPSEQQPQPSLRKESFHGENDCRII